MPVALQLVVLEMPGRLPGLPQPTTFDLKSNPSRTTLFVGRQADNDIILADSSVSRHHVEVQIFEDGITVRDLASANGTFLNNERLAPQVQTLVRPGDRLRIGNVLTLLKNVSNVADLPTTAINSDNSTPTSFVQSGNNYAASNPASSTYDNVAGFPPQNTAGAGYNPSNALPLDNYQVQSGTTPYSPNQQAGNYQAAHEFNTYSPVEYAPAYVPVQPVPPPFPAYQTDNYVPDLYPNQAPYSNSQASQPFNQASSSTSNQVATRRRNTQYLWLLPLLIVVIIVLSIGGFFLVQALNQNTSSFTTFEQLNLPSSPSSSNSVTNVLGVSMPVFNNWKRAQDSSGNRVVYSKTGQVSTAVTVEKPPSATLTNPSLSAETAVRQYVANVQANAQNVSITTSPVQVKLKDGTLGYLTTLQFTVPTIVTDYHMTALAVQCNNTLYFITAAAQATNDDAATDTDLKAAITNVRCK